MENQTNKIEVIIPSYVPEGTKKVLYNIINYVRENLLEIIQKIDLMSLERYKHTLAKILAANEMGYISIKPSYEAVYDNVISTYNIEDIKNIEVEPYYDGINITITLINNITIKIILECVSTMFMKKETFKKLQSLTEQYKEYIENIIEEKQKEEENKKKINELIDKLWNHYDIKQAIKTILEKYDIDVDDVEKLVDSIAWELEKMKKIISDKDEYIKELENENIIMRRFINENDLAEKFIEWYIKDKQQDTNEELAEEARKIIRIYEDEEDDC